MVTKMNAFLALCGEILMPIHSFQLPDLSEKAFSEKKKIKKGFNIATE
jgi:hypothetical protein